MSLYELKEDGGVRLKFHVGQSRAWLSESRYVWVLAGTQGGKTSFGPWWLNREIDRLGSGDYLAGTASYDLFKLKMLPELREVFESVLRRARYWSRDKILELRDPTTGRFWAQRADDQMWGRIILRSAESKGGLESATALAAWLDEAGQDSFTSPVVEAVVRRLSLQRGRLLGTTTLYNLGYLKTIYDEWKKGLRPDTDVIQFASIYNPEFSREEYLEAKRRLPGWRFRMFYRGEFERPAGVVYDCFDRETMVVEAFRKPEDWVGVGGRQSEDDRPIPAGVARKEAL